MASTRQESQHTAVDELRAELIGELVARGDPVYDAARQVFFKGIDRRPAAIARVAGTDDVARVIRGRVIADSSSPFEAAGTAAPATAPAMAVS